MSDSVREGTGGGMQERNLPMKGDEFKAIGVDGCRSGWFYVALSPNNRPEWGVVSKLEYLLPKVGGSDRIFVDIPVGLPTGNEGRDCDYEAREMLVPRNSSVFPAPVRAVLGAASYEDAKNRSNAACGKMLSIQAWCLVPKIREVDTLLRRNDNAKCFVREVHPELCFWALNGRKPMSKSKKEDFGFEERLRVLTTWLPCAENVIAEVQSKKIRGVLRDDIVDAMVAAVTALADPSTLRTVPENPPLDSLGLPMEMVYADPDLLAKHPLKVVWDG